MLNKPKTVKKKLAELSPAEAVWRICDETAKRPECSNVTHRLVSLTQANEGARRFAANDKLKAESDKKDELRDEVDAITRHNSGVSKAND